MNWYVKVLKKYVVFGGRAQRTEYWVFVLFSFFILNAIAAIEWFVLDVPTSETSVLATVYTFAIVLPGLSVTIRRLHDTGRSGWWLLIGAIPLIGGFVLLIFLLMDSQAGENAYGPFPKVDTQAARARWGFWLGWVFMTTVGLGLGLSIADSLVFVTMVSIDEIVLNDPVSVLAAMFSFVLFAIGGAAAGLTLGTAQWLMLQEHFSRSSRWILGTAAGFSVGSAIGTLISEPVALALTGAMVALAQWVVLRRWQVPKANWWVVASLAGAAVSSAALEIGSGTGTVSDALLLAALVMLFGYGAITAAAMVWLLGKSVNEDPSLPPEIA